MQRIQNSIARVQAHFSSPHSPWPFRQLRRPFAFSRAYKWACWQATASEISFYIDDDNQDNIEKKTSEGSVNSEQLEETLNKINCITKRSWARWSNELIFRLIDEYKAQSCLWHIFSNDYHNRDVTGKVALANHNLLQPCILWKLFHHAQSDIWLILLIT